MATFANKGSFCRNIALPIHIPSLLMDWKQGSIANKEYRWQIGIQILATRAIRVNIVDRTDGTISTSSSIEFFYHDDLFYHDHGQFLLS